MNFYEKIDLMKSKAAEFKMTLEGFIAAGKAAQEVLDEKSSPEAREAAKPRIRDWFTANPDVEYAKSELSELFGLKPTNADAAYVNNQIKRLRLTAAAAE